jgi:hypothetical protein
MGFFENLKRAHRAATDQLEGDRLWDEVKSTLRTIDPVYRSALEQYVALLQATAAEVSNFSREGRINVGMAMQHEARAKFNFDVAGAHALWLAGAWLEAGERSSPGAQRAFNALNSLAMKAVQVYGGSLEGTGIVDYREGPASQPSRSYPTFESWFAVFRDTAAAKNPQLATNDSGRSLIDFMDHTPLKRAYKDGVSPEQLAHEFANQFDASAWLKAAGMSTSRD